ncbi:MAG: cell division ATPase MinD [Candidatus Aenigmarchaeota archaeon]|nr:cell division ATPase MinD [Candidatus Aenigmarchaeota archaeon]
MTRLILLTSGKGGVGKTTLTSNLAASLAEFGENVIAMDANLTTPNLGLQLGMHLTPHTLHDVLKGKSRLQDAIYPHPLGFRVIPSSLGLDDIKGVDVGRLPEISFSLLGKADYVIMDSAAGIGREALSAISATDEIIIVTNPDLPAVTDALKMLKIAQEPNIKIIGTVVNRMKGEKHELMAEKIEEILGIPIIAEIPEDDNVALSIAAKKPLVNYSPNSPAAIEIKKLAAWLSGRKYEKIKSRRSMNLLQRFVAWLTK